MKTYYVRFYKPGNMSREESIKAMDLYHARKNVLSRGIIKNDEYAIISNHQQIPMGKVSVKKVKGKKTYVWQSVHSKNVYELKSSDGMTGKKV